MSENIFVWPIELPEGTTGKALEKYWVKEFMPKGVKIPGMENKLYKGYMGKRDDQYYFITYFASSARQRELFPIPNDPTGNEEVQQFFADPVNAGFYAMLNFEQLMASYSNYAEIK